MATVTRRLRIKTTGIDHVVLWVNDLERSKRFYMDLLGMRMAHEADGRAFLKCGEQQVALFDVKHGPKRTKGDTEMNHMALRMEPASYEAVKARLEADGIAAYGRPGDATCVYFDDPDGHRLQLLYSGHE